MIIRETKRMQTPSELCQETAAYFQQLEQDRDAAQDAYKHILRTMDTALAANNYALLEELISYIESGDGQLAFQYIGKTHRFLRMLHIIALENKYRLPSFCADCDNASDMWDKYMLTLFAFRRLIFQLSDRSTEEAVVYLRSRPLSHFAAYMLTQDGRLIPDRKLYKNIAAVYAQEWSPADTQQFFALAGLS